jgi:hypothetical protein
LHTSAIGGAAAVAVCVALVVAAAVLTSMRPAAGQAQRRPDISSWRHPTATSRRNPIAASPPRPAAPTVRPISVKAAAAFGQAHGLRVGVAVADLTRGRIAVAGDPGYFGTASVVKVLVAAKMLLTGAMRGTDGALAYEMVTRSDDDDCSALWARYGGPSIVTWLGHHYGLDIGLPNLRSGFWGNTRVTARGLAAFYLAAVRDPAVGPWLADAMAHTTRTAADGTNQYFGIPAAGGGHVIKQGWGTASSGDGYAPDATLNTTGIVTAGATRYAVVILTEGHGNDGAADARGYVPGQGALLTEMARRVITELRSAQP